MSHVDENVLDDYHLAVCKVMAMLPVFVEEVRKSEFDKPWRATSIAALADLAKTLLSTATSKADVEAYREAGDEVASVFWGIGEQLMNIQGEGEDRSDLCWGLLHGMEALLEKVGLMTA